MNTKYFVICIALLFVYFTNELLAQNTDYTKNVLTISVHKDQGCGIIQGSTRTWTPDSTPPGHFTTAKDSTKGYSIGTGFIYNYKGEKYVVTCNHVLYRAGEVKGHDHLCNIYELELIGSDIFHDIAILKFKNAREAETLEALELKTEYDVGDAATTVGYWRLDGEFNINDGKITRGDVGLFDLPLVRIGFIESNADSEIGYSGGLLLDKKTGKILGMNNSRHSDTEKSYALSARLIQRIAGQLIEKGSMQRAYLGLQVSENQDSGIVPVRIDNVIEGSPAYPDKKKLEGRIIEGINGTPVNSIYDVLRIMESISPSDNVLLQLDIGKVLLEASILDAIAHEYITTHTIRENHFDQCLGIEIVNNHVIVKRKKEDVETEVEILTIGKDTDLVFCAPKNLAELGILIRIFSLHKEIELGLDAKHRRIVKVDFAEQNDRRILFY